MKHFIIICCCYIVCGIGFFFTVAQKVNRQEAVQGWPTTAGQILEADWQVSQVKSIKRVWSVKYRYRVQGISYTNHRISYTDVRSSSRNVDEIYEKGKNVTVFYNPMDHSDAVLEHLVDPSVYKNAAVFTLVVGSLFSLGSWKAIFLGTIQRR